MWNDDCEKTFRHLKVALTEAPLLNHYDPSLPIKLETDASDSAVAGVLSQQRGGEWHPIAYYSKTINPAEHNYGIHDQELLAIIHTLEEWRAELQGLQRAEPFKIFTDHQALQYFMQKQRLNPQQAQWNEFLSSFRFLITFQPRKLNTLADALSRPEDLEGTDNHRIQLMLKPDHLDPRILAAVTPSPMSIVDWVSEANRLHDSLQPEQELARVGSDQWELRDGLLLFQGRLVVPDEGDLRARLLDEIHRPPSSAHPGKAKMKRLVRARYYWTS
jgi:hypothetical protein